jgi:hypothetical protein
MPSSPAPITTTSRPYGAEFSRPAGTPAKLALATICDGIPSNTCRPDLRHCAAAVDSVPEAESRLLAEMDKVLAVWLKRTVGRKADAVATGEAVSRRRNKRQSKRLCNAGT